MALSFDTHLHMDSIGSWGSAEPLLSYLDREKVDWAIGFFPLPPDRSSPLVSHVESIIRAVEGRVIPLIHPCSADDGWSQFLSGEYSEAVLHQYLQPQELFRGVGELCHKHSSGHQKVTFDSPPMQTAFHGVNESKGIVMIHPIAAWWGGPAELTVVESSIRKYPDTIFLFHNLNAFDLAAPLMSKYPNVYFTLDFGSSFRLEKGIRLGATGSKDATSFLASVNQTGLDYIVERNLRDLTPLLQQYPDRIFWGTDHSTWHYEEAVTDVVIRISRQFIGRLPADIQEKYAYQNAQRVFGRFLTPRQ